MRTLLTMALGVATSMAGSAALAAPCAGFTDVLDTDPFCTSIAWVKNRAITLGCGDGTTYCPDSNVTRKQMAVFLYRLGVQNAFLNGGNAFGADAVLGTTDGFDLVLTVNNAEALRLQPGGGESPNLFGGHPENGGVAFFNGQTVGGGGRTGSNCWNPQTNDFTRACRNTANRHYATVGGGLANLGGADSATVAGGSSNLVTGTKGTIAGGFNNWVSAEDALIAGGENNRASALAATVGGGTNNRATQAHAVVAGGNNNLASGFQAVVAGGLNNQAIGISTVVGGGFSNVAQGTDSAIPGGKLNWTQGELSVAAGHRAKALNKGCFTWADSTNFDFFCGLDDAFSARALGGFYFVTGVDFNNNGSVLWGCSLLFLSGGWSCASDRALKEHLVEADGAEVLRRLVSMPLYYWSPKGIQGSVRHLGPMAQDFSAAFAVGHDDKMISAQDADGVALAAIQGLYGMLKQRDARIDELTAEVAELRKVRSELAELRRSVANLIAQSAADRTLAASR